jgi:hypothetical protein
MSSPLVLISLAILIVGALVFVSTIITKKHGHIFDQEKYQIDWLKIENALTPANPHTFATVIIDADKLLDKALCEFGAPGKTTADRLKSVKAKFTKKQAVYYAHQLRNQIAHEHNFKPSYKQSRHALLSFRQALIDIGAI